MTPTKILMGQVLLVFAIVIATLWFATQWAAAQLGYQAQLGMPWVSVASYPVYYPWRLFEWWYAFDAYAPNLFNEAGAIAAGGGVAGIVVAVIGSLWRARQNRLVTTFGSSRWASRREVEQAGLFHAAGVFLGQLGQQYLRHDGPEHVMAFAPTRSGKGVGLVIPTLLTWTGSSVVHDIKGENWQLTAGWRARFSHCLLFNPTDLRSARYNPLLEVRKGADEVRDVQNIADILVDPEGALERRNLWEKTGHSLLVGAILHVLYAEEEKTLARVATFLSDPRRSFEHTLRAMMATNHLGTTEKPEVHPVVASAAREVLNKSDNERSGVLSTAMSFLGLYRDPVVAATTSACDWRITDLVDAERPVSLYLVIPPSDISRTKPLVRLILNQIGRRLTERLEGDPGKRRRHQLLMMLDEFPALGRLDFFETALAFMAGYGIRAYLIAQSLNQISKAYGENNAILDNCHVRIAFSSNDERTAKRISDALGTATELRAQRNYAGHRLAPWLSHVMVSRQETARPLLTPGEVMQLPPADELAANRKATREPSRDGWIDAVQIYPYAPGALYRLYAAPEQVTDIGLQPGEQLVAVSAGDTVRWVVGDTTSGAGDTKQVHVLVKPFAPGLKTNLIVTTDRRTYHVAMESTERTSMAAISWTYPQDRLVALKQQNTRADEARPIDQGLSLDKLRFRYAISGDNPPWKPVRAFDDGSKVFIEFPARIDQGEAPPLFVVGPTGESELVNYRVRGNYYIVDRLFGAAELRLGQDPQQVVRISRTDAAKSASADGATP